MYGGNEQEFSPYLNYQQSSPNSPSVQSPTKWEPLRRAEKGPREIHSQSLRRLRWYPTMLIIFLLWFGYTVGLIALLHLAAAAVKENPNLPWHYDVLPTLLQTLFTQAHLGITAGYLGRLAVTALHLNGTAPITWAELFWQADRKWQSPVGMLITLRDMSKLRPYRRLSYTFLSFVFIALLTMITPVLLTRAYPIVSIDVPFTQPRSLNVISKAKLESLDAYQQLGVGGGVWSTGLPPMDMFNGSVYTPLGTPRDPRDASDIFFASYTSVGDASLPGVRMQGGCKVVLDISPDQYSTSEVFRTSGPCGQKEYSQYKSPRTNFSDVYATISAEWCSNMSTFPGFLDAGSKSTGTGSSYLWINATNSSDTTVADINPAFVQGVIKCDAIWTTGTASVHGFNLTYTNFTSFDSLPGASHAGEAPNHPLNSALMLVTPDVVNLGSVVTQFSSISRLTMLGYTPFAGQFQDERFQQPSLEEIATRIWWGTTYMALALGSLSQEIQTRDVVFFTSTSGRRVTQPFAKAVWVLIALWAGCLLALTMRLFRKTIGSSLDSYTAGRLLAMRPDLVNGYMEGTMDENEIMMGTKFDGVHA